MILRETKNVVIETSNVYARHVTVLSKENDENLRHFQTAFRDIGLLSLGKSMLVVKYGFADISVWMGGFVDASQVTMGSCKNFTNE